jgi:ethanolaminephosphotransferase
LKFIPVWVAPNLITLVAFLIVLVSHVVFMFAGSGVYTDSPARWQLFLFGITLLIYQHLDNIDGKQARKTSMNYHNAESSSPIGMLFDHGADAITGVIFGIQITKLINIQDQ